jgi:hypothetical protein
MFDARDIKNARKVEIISTETDLVNRLPAVAKLTVIFGLVLSMFSAGNLPQTLSMIAGSISEAKSKDIPNQSKVSQTIIIKNSELKSVTINQRNNK